jgi:hypothetical protein
MFEIASASVMGSDHAQPLLRKNNQDARHSINSSTGIIAVVCDGCSSSEYSEVGAQIGARIIAEAIKKFYGQYFDQNHSNLDDTSFSPNNNSIIEFPYWEDIRKEVLVKISDIAIAICGGEVTRFSKTVNDYFLFSTVGALVTPWGTAAFCIGDGEIIVNGNRIKVGPFPGNEPPYLAYALVETTLKDKSPKLLKFSIKSVLPTCDLQSLVIGTDGLGYLIDSADKKIPGREELVGPISQFWEQNRYFQNPDAIRRRLAVINRGHEGQEGLLLDDTTMIVVRRLR